LLLHETSHTNIIKKGKLSAHRDESGQYFIDKSEFFRVYPQDKKVEQTGSSEKSQAEIPKVNTPEKVEVESKQDGKGDLSQMAK